MENLLTQYFVYEPHPFSMIYINEIILKHAKGKGDGVIEKFSIRASDIYSRVQLQLTEQDGNIEQPSN